MLMMVFWAKHVISLCHLQPEVVLLYQEQCSLLLFQQIYYMRTKQRQTNRHHKYTYVNSSSTMIQGLLMGWGNRDKTKPNQTPFTLNFLYFWLG